MLTAVARRRLAVALFIFVWFAYLATASGRLKTADVQREFKVAANLLDHGGLEGENNLDARIGVDGKPYATSGIAASIILIPAALVGGGSQTEKAIFVEDMVNPLLAAGTVTLLLLLLLDMGFGGRVATAICLVFAFATIEWPYAHDAFDVTAAGAVTLLAVVAARRRAEGGSLGALLLSGISLGVALLIRISSGLLLVPLAAYLAWKRRRQGAVAVVRELAMWAVPIVVGLAVQGWHDWVRFGNAFDVGARYPLQAYVQPLANQGLAFIGLLVSPGKGILLFSPIFVLGAIGLVRLVRRDASFALLTVAIVVFHLVFYARINPWSGDQAWGPRYLVPVVPFFMLWTAPALASWRELGRVAKAAVGVLVAAGVAVQATVILTGYERVIEAMDQPPPPQTVSDPGWYFVIGNSQLLRQFKAVGAMLFGPNPFGPYATANGSNGLTYLYTPDLWWADPWSTPGLRPFLVLVAVLLLLLVVLSGLRLLKAVRALPQEGAAGALAGSPVIKSEQVSQIL
ncbi:MAG TPA: hypothetical protein VG329_10670 [Candidatus Dormibacteraeota bacterium]|nr:hypothetical protein [Candidatus Dormibacteraeota bacterium]